MGAMLMTPLSAAEALAQASYNFSSYFYYSSSWFHFILPVNNPSRILFIFICYHFEGMKFFLEGG
jgi:hypothetical protein